MTPLLAGLGGTELLIIFVLILAIFAVPLLVVWIVLVTLKRRNEAAVTRAQPPVD